MNRITEHRLFSTVSESFTIELFSSARLQEGIKHALDVTGKWEQRQRALTAPMMVSLTLLLNLHRAQSTQNVFRKAVNMLRETALMPPGEEFSLKPVTKEALYHARSRLGFEPLKVLFEHLAENIRALPTFHGLCVHGIDGVKLNMPDTPRNDAAFGRPSGSRGNAAFPQMLGTVLVDTKNHRIEAAVFDKSNGSERKGLEKLIERFGSEDLTLMDRGYPAVWLFEAMLKQSTHFLARLASTWKPRKVRRLGPGDWIVEVSGKVEIPIEDRDPNGTKYRWVDLTLRMIEYTVKGGETVRLLTDLRDTDRFPAMDLAHLYHERWEVELVFDELKTHLDAVTHGTMDTSFRSHTPEGVLQEAYALFIAYNCVRGLIMQAGEAAGIPPLEISFVDALEVIRAAIPEFQNATEPERSRLLRRLMRDLAACRLELFRRPRWYPRVVKVKMSKFKLKRPGDSQVIINFNELIELVKDRSRPGKAA